MVGTIILRSIRKDGKTVGKYTMEHSAQSKNRYYVEFEDKIHINNVFNEIMRIIETFQVEGAPDIEVTTSMHGIEIVATREDTFECLFMRYFEKLLDSYLNS